MPYVPPHLRGKEGAAAPSAPAGPPSESSGRGFGSRNDGGGYRDGGSMSRNSSYGNLSRTGSYSQMPRAQSYGRNLNEESRRTPVEPVFADWQPSERVKGLTEEQIAEIRQRLNVTVQVKPGQPAAQPPIESFQEMVSEGFFQYALACFRVYIIVSWLHSHVSLAHQRLHFTAEPSSKHHRGHHSSQV